jgi:hypothetical protein
MDRPNPDVWNEEAPEWEQHATARALVTPELQELIASAREAYSVLCAEYHCDPDEDEVVKRLREATRPFDAIWV